MKCKVDWDKPVHGFHASSVTDELQANGDVSSDILYLIDS